jgi:hypothetical protein
MNYRGVEVSAATAAMEKYRGGEEGDVLTG